MIEVKIGSEGVQQVWGRDIYRFNYDLAYRELFAAPAGANSSSRTVGGKEVAVGDAAKRWIQYEAVANRMCIHEVSLKTDLRNSSICVVFGDDLDSSILAVDAFAQAEKSAVCLCISLSNGSFHILSLPVADDTSSILSIMVERTEGRVFHVGGVASGEEKGYFDDFSGNHSWFTSTYYLNSINTRKDSITSSSWASAAWVLFGLAGGDIVAASIDGEAGCSEHVLKGVSTGGALQALWSGLGGAASASNEAVTVEAIQMAPKSTLGGGCYAVSVSLSSAVKLWNVKTKQCLLTRSLSQLCPNIAQDRGDDKAGFIHGAKIALCDAADTYASIDGCASIMALIAVDLSSRGLRKWQLLHVAYTVPQSGAAADATLVSILSSPSVDSFGHGANVHHAPLQLLDLQFSCGFSGAVSVWRSLGSRLLCHAHLHGLCAQEPILGSHGDSSVGGAARLDYRTFREAMTVQMEPIKQVPTVARSLDVDAEEDAREVTARCMQHLFLPGRCSFGAVRSVLEREYSGGGSGSRLWGKRSVEPPLPPLTAWTEDAVILLTREVAECIDQRVLEVSADENCSLLDARKGVFIDFISRCERRQIEMVAEAASATGGLVRFRAVSEPQQLLGSALLVAALAGCAGAVDLAVAPTGRSIFAPAPEPCLGVDLSPVCKNLVSLVSNSCSERQILDLDDSLVEYMSRSPDITSGNSSWLDSALRQIAASLQALCTPLGQSLQGASSRAEGLVGSLLQLISLGSRDHRDEGRADTIGHGGCTSFVACFAAAELAKTRVFELYRTAQCVCVALLLLTDTCLLAPMLPFCSARASLFAAGVRSAKSRLLQLALLLWTDSVRPCRRFLQLVDVIDFQGICHPYGLSSPSPAVTRKTVVLHSTWVNFYRLRPAFSDGSCDCDLSCVALTLTGELATFLALAGQFSLLRRWLSLLLYVAADDDGSTDGSPSAVHQPRCAHAFAALVDVLSAVHTSNVGPHGDVDFGGASEVKARASALIAATPPAGSSRAAEEIQSLFGDAAFRSLVASAPEKSSPADLLSAAEHCRPQARFVFDSFARISHLADSLEALKRVLLVLPRELSSEIVLDACYALIDGVAATAEAIESAAGQSVESQPFSRQLSSHTSTAWRQAYEAALEGCALDDAVSALQRGVALLRSDDEQGMRPGGAQGTRLAEQQLVSALAARACAEGKAGWLLSLPLLLADPDGEGGAVNLTALLASEMERLATVSDVSTFLHDPWGRLSGSPCKSLAPSSSHYEVLLALLLRHQDFREAARVATALFIRLRGEGLAAKYPSVSILEAQSRALLVAVHARECLPPPQRPDLAAASSSGADAHRGLLEDALKVARARGLAPAATRHGTSSEADLDLAAALCQQGLFSPPVSLLAAGGDCAAQKALAGRAAAHYSSLLASCLGGGAAVDGKTQQMMRALALAVPYCPYASSSDAAVVTDALADLLARCGGAQGSANISYGLRTLSLVHSSGGAADSISVFVGKGMFPEAAEACIALLSGLLASPPSGEWLPLHLLDEVLHGLPPGSRDAQLLTGLLRQYFELNIYREL